MQTPTCVRCPGVKLRLRSRELIEIYRMDRLDFDATLDARIWVCPNCRRIELQWPEDMALPEEEPEGEEIRAAARKLLAERK